MTTLQGRLERLADDLVIGYHRPHTYPEALLKQAADTLDQATQIIERLALRLPIGDHATIEARRFLDGLNAGDKPPQVGLD